MSEFHQRALAQIQRDFENTKKRVLLAQALKAQGYSKEQVERALKAIAQPDITDLFLAELEGQQ